MASAWEGLLGSMTFAKFIRDTHGSAENLISQARAGVWEAQQDLGLAHAEGVAELSIPKDRDKAIGLLTSAVENGLSYPSVIHQLATLYDCKGLEEGSAVCQRKAYELYHKAAEFGCVHSQINLGEIYRCGIDGVVNEDMGEAFKWFKQAAGEQAATEPHPFAGIMQLLAPDMKFKALHHLYECYLSGDCPEKKPQPAKALYYLERAAELGDIESQRDLGRAYLMGSCCEKDLIKAERWLEKAAKKGNMEAQKFLQECKEEAKCQPHGPNMTFDMDYFKQTMEVQKEKLEQLSAKHPFAISNPTAITEEVLRAYPKSPTAQRYLKAYKLAEKGLQILRSSNYTDKQGLTCLAQSWLTENTMLSKFLIHQEEIARFIVLASNVLSSGEPNFFEGILVILALLGRAAKRSKKSVVQDQGRIAALDNLIHLIQLAEPCSDTKFEPGEFGGSYRSWLHELLFFKGSLLSILDQSDEAAEAFGKSVELCPTDLEAKAGLGYCLFNAMGKKKSTEEGLTGLEPDRERLKQQCRDIKQRICSDDKTWEKVKELYDDYLENAPKCSKKYPNACYHMAKFYLMRRNIPKMQEYFRMGQDAEEVRLPFLGPVNLPIKEMLSSFCHLVPSVRCSNPGCSRDGNRGALKNCPCRKVFYCDRDCQRADWENHKLVCDHKGKKKSKK